ncbi:MAG: fatty acid desaturase [Deltaproteobacteria bacterium]
MDDTLSFTETQRGDAAEGNPFPGTPELARLVARDGRNWQQFRRTLEPHFRWVWLDIGVRYAAMFGILALACLLAAVAGPTVGLVLAPFFAIAIGFWFATIVLFMHEGAHYNLAADKKTNDQLVNAFCCILIGGEIRDYRVLHWQHHLKLGEVGDSEVSYRYAPDLRFLLETVFGVHAWRVFGAHSANSAVNRSGSGPNIRYLLRGFAAHFVLLLGLVLAGFWTAALAWVLAVAIVFPYLSALRQQLEHRSFEATRADDFATIPHGAINRMFVGSLGARAFGSAGFWRHLLHHWDPSVSYSRYDELERFLMATELAPQVDEARTSYLAVWRALSRAGGDSPA